jgi:hypothetical protein
MANVILRVIQNAGEFHDISIEEQEQEDALYNLLIQQNNDPNNATIVLINNKGLLERIFNPLDKSFTELKDRFTRAKIRAEAGEDTSDNLNQQIKTKKNELSDVQKTIKDMPFFSWIRSFFITDPNYTSQSTLKNEIAVLEERLKEISPKSSSGTTSDSINTTEATEAEVEKALSTPPPFTPTLGGVSVGADESSTSDSKVVVEPLEILPTLDKVLNSTTPTTATAEKESPKLNKDSTHIYKSTSPEARYANNL